VTLGGKGVSAQIETAFRSMADALRRWDYEEYLRLEAQFYLGVVKPVETEAHHEQCYAALDPLGEVYGEVLKSALPSVTGAKRGRRLCYLLPDIDNDLAHIEFLYNVLIHHDPDSDLAVTVAGYGSNGASIGSRYLSRLAAERRVSLIKISDSHQGRLQFLRFFCEQGFSQLVVFSVPLQISGWVRVLGADVVTWVTTKFELASFRALKSRVSFFGPSAVPTDTKSLWRRSSAAISPASIVEHRPATAGHARLITINRAEKIRHPVFLESVSRILRQEPDASFSWTGRSHDAEIQSYFERSGVADRCRFVGWVDPVKTLGEHDIFLDTFALSGMVATQSFCSGMPTVFFRDSRAWVQIYEESLQNHFECSPRHVLAASIDDYVSGVLALIRDPSAYAQRCADQKRFAKRFFLDEKLMYETHMSILREAVDKAIERGNSSG